MIFTFDDAFKIKCIGSSKSASESDIEGLGDGNDSPNNKLVSAMSTNALAS